MSTIVWSYTGVRDSYRKLATSEVLDTVFKSLVSTLTVTGNWQLVKYWTLFLRV